MREEPVRKRRRLSPVTRVDKVDGRQTGSDPVSEIASTNVLLQLSANWDLEQDYERRPRKNKDVRESTRLPIKTAEGTIEPSRLRDVSEEKEEEEEGSEFGMLDDGDTTDVEENGDAKVENSPEIPLKEQIYRAKEELAKMAALLNEDPEENVCFSGVLRH